jgi:hypothetical protein
MRDGLMKLLPPSTRGRAPAAGKILGTPRLHEPRAPLARPGQGAASSRTARLVAQRQRVGDLRTHARPRVRERPRSLVDFINTLHIRARVSTRQRKGIHASDLILTPRPRTGE